MLRSLLTISLGSLDLLEQALEPTKGGGVAADPEELDTPEGSDFPLPLTVPDVLQDGCEWSHT